MPINKLSIEKVPRKINYADTLAKRWDNTAGYMFLGYGLDVIDDNGCCVVLFCVASGAFGDRSVNQFVRGALDFTRLRQPSAHSTTVAAHLCWQTLGDFSRHEPAHPTFGRPF